MSPDGRLVVFEHPDALVPNDSNRAYDVFLRDMVNDTVELISARDAMLPTVTPNSFSLVSAYSITADGRYVAFADEADNLVPGDTNGCRDVFVCDLVLATNVLASMAADGSAADNLSTEPAIAANGRYVAFTSGADNLVPGDTNKVNDVSCAICKVELPRWSA